MQARGASENKREDDPMLKLKAACMAAFAISLAGVAQAEGDAAAGEKVFNKCKACHTVDAGGNPAIDSPEVLGRIVERAGHRTGAAGILNPGHSGCQRIAGVCPGRQKDSGIYR